MVPRRSTSDASRRWNAGSVDPDREKGLRKNRSLEYGRNSLGTLDLRCFCFLRKWIDNLFSITCISFRWMPRDKIWKDRDAHFVFLFSNSCWFWFSMPVRGSGGPSSEVRGSGRRRGGGGDGYMSYVPQNVGHELNLITYIDWRCMPLWLRNCLRQSLRNVPVFFLGVVWNLQREATVSSSYWAGFLVELSSLEEVSRFPIVTSLQRV